LFHIELALLLKEGEVLLVCLEHSVAHELEEVFDLEFSTELLKNFLGKAFDLFLLFFKFRWILA
jgi:hypothetical protein